jgi:DNA invertase Pin-like site-specific DNA recombinase
MKDSNMPILGYSRVSTDGQTLDAQHASLIAAGAAKVFSEKVSGVITGRKQLQKAIDALKSGDVLLVTRIDRLARSTRDLLNVLHQITEKGAGFKSLGDPMIDTTSPHGRLLLQIMGALAEFERSMILARTAEGRKRALDRGVKFGRKPKLTPFQKREVLNRVANGESQADLARVFAVNPSTIYRMVASAG